MEVIFEILFEIVLYGWFYAANGETNPKWLKLTARALFWFGILGVLPLFGAIKLWHSAIGWAITLGTLTIIGIFFGIIRSAMVFLPTVRHHILTSKDPNPFGVDTDGIPAPRTVPLSFGMKLTAIIFAILTFIIAWGAVVIFSSPILKNNSEPISLSWRILLFAFVTVIGSGTFHLSATLLIRWIGKRGAMTLTPMGITDTFAIFTLLAFWTSVRIPYLPWKAVSFETEKKDSLSVNTELLPPQKGFSPVHWMLKKFGFPFSVGNISAEELRAYRDTSLNASNQSDPSSK